MKLTPGIQDEDYRNYPHTIPHIAEHRCMCRCPECWVPGVGICICNDCACPEKDE